MDPSNSTSSNASTSSKGPFAYQTRLLERTSSRGASSLSRSNSQSSINNLINSTGSTVAPATTRRRIPTHRVGSSLDVVRGKFEELARESGGADDTLISPASPVKDTYRNRAPSAPSASALVPSKPLDREPPTPVRSPVDVERRRTPIHLKRRTLPAPIIASPLSPNVTGISVEVDSPLSSIPNRIHLPDAIFNHSSSKHGPTNPSPSGYSQFQQTDAAEPHTSFRTSSSPVDAQPDFNFSRSLQHGDELSLPSSPRSSSSPTLRRPVSVHGAYPHSFPGKYIEPRLSSTSSIVRSTHSNSGAKATGIQQIGMELSKPTSVMSPVPYRSSYMSNKKSGEYSSTLGIGHHKLGRHLPRIASGDGDDSWEEKHQSSTLTPDEEPVRSDRQTRGRQMQADGNGETLTQKSPKLERPSPIAPIADAVMGLPNRIPLKAPTLSPSPLPSARLSGGLWADKQRHLIQAYEYLCHVGEAQQWIEGCLGEELEFGVVEMEEGLRNGIVLAKLVRVFRGDAAVRKIYEASKLDFRHSDNINYFFNFVRHVGLPEGFIFELTDLYEKKNLPKVIYCIHALSHLLARRGMAERIGNLLGQLQFSDDQLQRTQKGLKDAGVAMPNFGNVGRELAKEINEEPEIEAETEDEYRDRLLLENEASIIAFQAHARRFLTRKTQQTLHGRIRLAERHISKFQTHCRGLLLRKRLFSQRQARIKLTPWIVALQAICRAIIIRRRWHTSLHRIKTSVMYVIKVQAQIRGVLQRRRFARLKANLRKFNFPIVRFQAVARAHLTRRTRAELSKTFFRPDVELSIISFQSLARGALVRRQASLRFRILKRFGSTFTALQAHCRGILVRRRMRAQVAKLENVSHVVVRIQAAVRTYLARKRLLLLIRGLRKATPIVVGLQARARASLKRQQHQSINKALAEVQSVISVGNLQALARASLVRNKHRQINKELTVALPDIVGLQATARAWLLRRDFCAWRDHLLRSQTVATILQAMLRGTLQRRAFRAKMDYYSANLRKVVIIQSLFRAKETREQYRQLTLGKNVTVGTIKNFVHLLDDSEADFQEEIKVERLRKRVVEHIRENQALENEVNDLEVKIALIVQNVKSFDELIKARKRHGADSAAAHAARVSLLAAHGDPFSGPNTLDQDARRKLELYQQLFYLLQTRGEYLSKLFVRSSVETCSETSRRFIERVVLTLFGYGQDRREDFLLLKLFQLAIRDEIAAASSMNDIVRGHPLYINIAVHYIRPRQVTYVKDAYQSIIREVIDSADLDLEVDPSVIHRARIDVEEMRSGVLSSQPKDISFREALADPDTRGIYIRHLQVLQWWTEAFVTAITQSTRKMPYGMRYLARETLLSLRSKFPDASDEIYATCIGRLVYYRYINPAIITPETFDIVSKTVNIAARKNLAQISKILTQIMSGEVFDDDNPIYVPINDYVRKAILQMSTWLIEVADVPDAESQFHAHEFLDATVQPKPIYISPNEIYTVHSLLSQHQDYLTASNDDTLKVILAELGGVPHLDNEELKDARDSAITLELTNRFADVRDPLAEEKTLWVQAKRGVLAILRVQPAQDLIEALMRRVTEDDELMWEEILDAEMENEMRHNPRRQPSAVANDSAYRLEDIRSLKFAAVKALAISNLLELEKGGKISRADGFQGILNAIAGDVRSKHRKRIQRQQEMTNMNEALRQLAERKKYFEEQIDSYHSYAETAMNTMQRGKGKKRFVLPFTKQYFHLRDLQRSGQTPQFGSFLYTAKYLYDKGILLSIDQYSPRQFDKLQLTMSSNTAGIFTLSLESTLLGIVTRIASEDVRMEDLLQAKYEKRPSLALFNGKVKVNFELFLYQINKKFYV